MNELTGPTIVSIVIVCTLHLLLGLAAGLFVAGVFNSKSIGRVAELEEMIRFYRSRFDRIVEQTVDLSDMSTILGSSVPGHWLSPSTAWQRPPLNCKSG